MTTPQLNSVEDHNTESVDVVIIGAGFSGIGAAYRIAERNPGLSYVILEQRDQLGGTWDLFRYPGVRSDSSIFTLSFPWAPWTRREGMAGGDHIRDYIADAARTHGIDKHICYRSRVRSADWDSATDTWTVHADVDGRPKTYRTHFVFFGSGYYNYDHAYTPDLPGLEQFAGPVVHPQFWPQDLDYTDRSVVVIGSGATAISLIPALTENAAKVTMLQRSPSYVLSGSSVNPVTDVVRKFASRRVSHGFAKWYAALFEGLIWLWARKAPRFMKWFIRKQAMSKLPPGYPVDVHFKPRYAPWDQRLCAVPDGDLYRAISAGRADIVTDRIHHVDATGITLESGTHLDADIIVTATGLELLALGGVNLSIDGVAIEPQDRFVYKAHLLEDVPNLAWCVGYTNASWTLRADMTARSVAKLLAYMRTRGYTHAYPHLGDQTMPEKLAWDIKANYVLRNPHALPKSGTRRPWNVRQNFFADAIDHHFDHIDEDMVFGRSADVRPLRTDAKATAIA
ncbi:FAD-dependent oxidoreductase [Mycobacterium sp. MS1601]|uniref:flavin-containing monooxygenase n=1 Tax=Mycobacterium sp. MS1601 TaxID=1936029 RepID=UPI0009797EDA|nr:NAD(P)/FAD-dependent oxidoreductase [Mycobacterium sp. MS1601]AQA01890.1 FAD-dependent oxidoreductase [Mycobacterium sp. MS1601]